MGEVINRLQSGSWQHLCMGAGLLYERTRAGNGVHWPGNHHHSCKVRQKVARKLNIWNYLFTYSFVWLWHWDSCSHKRLFVTTQPNSTKFSCEGPIGQNQRNYLVARQPIPHDLFTPQPNMQEFPIYFINHLGKPITATFHGDRYGSCFTSASPQPRPFGTFVSHIVLNNIENKKNSMFEVFHVLQEQIDRRKDKPTCACYDCSVHAAHMQQ